MRWLTEQGQYTNWFLVYLLLLVAEGWQWTEGYVEPITGVFVILVVVSYLRKWVKW